MNASVALRTVKRRHQRVMQPLNVLQLIGFQPADIAQAMDKLREPGRSPIPARTRGSRPPRHDALRRKTTAS